MNRSFLHLAVGATVALGIAVVPVSADTTWDGSEGTSWVNADNWSAGVPDSADVAVFTGAFTDAPTFDASAGTAIGGMTFGASAVTITHSANVELINQGSLTTGSGGVLYTGSGHAIFNRAGVDNDYAFRATGGTYAWDIGSGGMTINTDAPFVTYQANVNKTGTGTLVFDTLYSSWAGSDVFTVQAGTVDFEGFKGILWLAPSTYRYASLSIEDGATLVDGDGVATWNDLAALTIGDGDATGASIGFQFDALADRVNVVGALTLDTDSVLTLDAFGSGPAAGVPYTIMTAGSLSGTFGSIVNNTGLALDTTFGTGGVLYDTTNDQIQVQFVPEPATMGLLALGGALALCRRRK